MWKTIARLLMALSVGLGCAQAQSFPTQPIKWIVPYPPGAATDTIARLLANEMKGAFSQPIVNDYKPGAATIIAADLVSQAAPDGHTIMSADNATLAYNSYVYKQLPYDPMAMTFVGAIGRFPMALVVHPDLPVDSVQAFIEHARRQPQKLLYGSVGVGSPHHLNMEYFLDRMGLTVTHVPYRGGAPAVQALLAGEVQAMFLDLVTGLQLMKTGKIKALALAAGKRAESLPKLPTMAEAGVADMELFAWQGVVGPARMAPEAVAQINAALNQGLRSQAFHQRFGEFAFEVMPGTPAAFQAFVRSENEKWGPFIRRKNISASAN